MLKLDLRCNPFQEICFQVPTSATIHLGGNTVSQNLHFNAGNKKLGRNGLHSLHEFAEWAINQDAVRRCRLNTSG